MGVGLHASGGPGDVTAPLMVAVDDTYVVADAARHGRALRECTITSWCPPLGPALPRTGTRGRIIRADRGGSAQLRSVSVTLCGGSGSDSPRVSTRCSAGSRVRTAVPSATAARQEDHQVRSGHQDHLRIPLARCPAGGVCVFRPLPGYSTR
jgi:hypothetical protein